MSTNDDATVDPDDTHCRHNRRPSVQFIAKDLIRRRSSGNDRQQQRLLSINSIHEARARESDRLTSYSENGTSQADSRREKHRTPPTAVSPRFVSSSSLATASDSDSDADDRNGVNTREMQHVGSLVVPVDCLTLQRLLF